MNPAITIVQIPVSELAPHPKNPRKDLGDLTELIASIKARGIRQNLTVTQDGPDGAVLVVCGHRRLAAAEAAGLETVPCVVEDMTEAEALELMAIENLQRTDITVLEEAQLYVELLDLGIDVDEIVAKTGRAETTVRRRVTVGRAPEAVRNALEQGMFNFSEALEAAALAFEHPDIYAECFINADGPASRSDLFRAQTRLRMLPQIEAVRAEGHRVIESALYHNGFWSEWSNARSELVKFSLVTLRIKSADHGSCPGAIALVSEWGAPDYACENARTHHPAEVAAIEARVKQCEDERNAPRPAPAPRELDVYEKANLSRRATLRTALANGNDVADVCALIRPLLRMLATDQLSIATEISYESPERCWGEPEWPAMIASEGPDRLSDLGVALAFVLTDVEHAVAYISDMAAGSALNAVDAEEIEVLTLVLDYLAGIEGLGFEMSADEQEVSKLIATAIATARDNVNPADQDDPDEDDDAVDEDGA